MSGQYIEENDYMMFFDGHDEHAPVDNFDTQIPQTKIEDTDNDKKEPYKFMNNQYFSIDSIKSATLSNSQNEDLLLKQCRFEELANSMDKLYQKKPWNETTEFSIHNPNYLISPEGLTFEEVLHFNPKIFLFKQPESSFHTIFNVLTEKDEEFNPFEDKQYLKGKQLIDDYRRAKEAPNRSANEQYYLDPNRDGEILSKIFTVWMHPLVFLQFIAYCGQFPCYR